MSQSQPRQNFHIESEAGINRQINMELYASYCYQSMVSFFSFLTQNNIVFNKILLPRIQKLNNKKKKSQPINNVIIVMLFNFILQLVTLQR
jgi:hypothetical protein